MKNLVYLLSWVIVFVFVSCSSHQEKPSLQKPVKIIRDIDDTEEINYDTLAVLSSSPETALLDSMAWDFIRQWEIKGMSIAISYYGKLVYAKGFGWADEERKIPVKPHHLFRIASASKLITTVGIMHLVEQGKFNLDSKVFGKNGILKRYNTWIADTTMYGITIRHLLTHTAGWWNYLRTDPMFVPVQIAQIMKTPSPPPFDSVMRFMLSQKKVFPPGSFYDYSNFGYALLGKIIEEVSGKDYETFMREVVLAKMQIRRMRIGRSRYKERFPHEVRYYVATNTPKNLSIYAPHDSASRAYEGTYIQGLGAAGGWIASSVDMLRFLSYIDAWENPKDFLTAKSIAEMTLQTTDSLQIQKALGWKQITPEKWWRTGNLASTNISLTRRSDGFAWVVITNTGSWRASFFPYEIEGFMTRALQKVKFKELDLFKFIK
ncbi:serine hydrolase domain-containing protein [Raineya sp.]|jgi:CubicO group peptidase (beta-lactamase class C family)